MMLIRSARLLRGLLFLGVTACGNGNNQQPDHRLLRKPDASPFFESYTVALASGDTAAIKPFWSSRSLEREGFWYLHAWVGGRLEVGDWPAFLELHDLEVEGVRPGSAHYAVDVRWMPTESAAEEGQSPKDMVYYLVLEDDRWVLENPIDVLTRDWLTHETECIRYRYPPGVELENHVLELEFMDRECAGALELLGLELRQPIEYFRARTPEECGDLLLHPPAHGYAAVGYPYPGGEPRGFPVVVSRSFLHPHELMHVLHVEARIPSLTAVLSEGLATALGGTATSTPDYASIQARNLLGRFDEFSLRGFLTMSDAEFFGRNYETYLLAGSLFRFLLEHFGVAPLTRLAATTLSQEDFLHTIPQTYGFTVEDLDVMWRAYLQDIPAPSVGFAVPQTAETVFSMEDQLYDDVGDGDYRPPERFEEGVFDLARFEVLRDKEEVHFRLGFRAVEGPVSYQEGGDSFSPIVVIAIGDSTSDHGPLQQTAHGVRFGRGEELLVKILVATRVSLADRLGRVFFTTPNVWNQLASPETGILEFSLPIDLIGAPTPNWRYFVGVGLASDRAMDFIHGGPAPAYREHPVYLSGGNYDFGNPAFIDVLLPEGVDQIAILSDYDVPAGRLVEVPMMGG